MNTNLCFLFLFKIYVFYIDRNSMNIEKLLIQPNTGVRFLKPRWCRLTHLIRELKWAFLGKKLSVVCCYCRCRQLITISSPLKNQWADFNQIWHNASLGEEYSNLLELRGWLRIIENLLVLINLFFKNVLKNIKAKRTGTYVEGSSVVWI